MNWTKIKSDILTEARFDLNVHGCSLQAVTKPIGLASEALLREKNPVTKCYPQWE